MKLSNIFKKTEKISKNVQISKIDLNQLEKIVGGISTVATSSRSEADQSVVNTTKSNTKDF